MSQVFPIFCSAFLSFLLLKLSLPILSSKLLDRPNDRSSHIKPTPSGGGVIFVFLSCLASFGLAFDGDVRFLSLLPLVCFPLALVGFLDDRYHLPSSFRFLVQLITVVFIYLFSPISTFFQSLALSEYFYSIIVVLFLISLVALVNFFNFMDGLDGLVSSCVFIILLALVIKFSAPLSSWILVGSLLGFIFLNWSPAKVFMGDVGSTFLGSVYVGFLSQSESFSQLFSCLLLATPLVADSFFCIVRRLISRQNIFRPHKLHLFQRLHQAGWTHSTVSLLYLGSCLFLSVLFIASTPLVLFIASFLILILGFYIDRRFAVPFCSSSFS